MIGLLALALAGAAPADAAAALDFEALSARYSVYPSIDDASGLLQAMIPPGTAIEAARDRLTKSGMACRSRHAGELVCRRSASVVVDGAYIRPILWRVTLRSVDGAVTSARIAAE
jgi:hypothetical protein